VVPQLLLAIIGNMLLHLLILVLVVGAVALYLMTPEERSRTNKIARAALREAGRRTTLSDLQESPFCIALRSRSRWVVATPAICALNIAAFIGMSAGSPKDSAEGFAAALFAHWGMWHLIFDLTGLLQVGFLLERLVGPFAFTTVYVSASMTCTLIDLFAEPSAHGVGASAGTLGLYGLFLASTFWSIVRPSALSIPLEIFKRVAPGIALFVVFMVATSRMSDPGAVAALLVGLAGGLATTRNIGERKPPMRRLAEMMGTAVAVSAVVTLVTRPVPRDTPNVRFELQRVLAVEAHTAHVYDRTVDRFKQGGVTVDALTDAIDRTILPELQAASTRLSALEPIAPEQQPVIAAAQDYLHLREESWRLRARALRASDVVMLRKADEKEHTSLNLLGAVALKIKA
jgi:membrane associated rhomboid family serine protease